MTTQQISFAVDFHGHGLVDPFVHTQSRSSGLTELLIIDEADRLKTTGLEQVRDFFDRHHLGVILIGMPGIEKRLAPLPAALQPHRLRPRIPTPDPRRAHRRPHPAPPDGAEAEDGGIAHATAIATIVRITGGNFRLVDRLVTQIERIQALNKLTELTPEVVDAARESLLIGH